MPSQRNTLVLGLAATASVVTAGPCDIYATGNTPCIAAHSTTRALYSSFSGSLYQVKRGSDGATTNIAPLSAGGVANAATQDKFCANTTCLITIIYDQSGRGNHLTQAPPGGFKGPEANGYDNLAAADGAPVTLNGQKAYGVFVSPGTGYRNNKVSGSATGDAAEGMYAVLDGTHYNGACCFDYGNAETNNLDTGNGHMEAIYFGDNTVWGSGSGSGPWVMADLENGLFSGANPKNNPADPSVSYRFLTTLLKGGANKWAIKGGNAASGALSTYYNGARPSASGYNPMSKEGAIILGIGGDNSNGAQGTFYEGVMTSGYPTDATETAVQANVVAAKYATTSLTSGPAYTVGSSISLRATTAGYTDRYLAHNGATVNTQVVSSSSTALLKRQASWTVRAGLANSACFSFESKDTAGSYIRHYNFVLQVQASDGSKAFKEDATFCPQTGFSGSGSSIRAWGYPTRYIRHFNNIGDIASNGGVHDFDAQASFNADATWTLEKGLA
ncbi:arabinofuranosidase/B-xylosidase precursor [Alternaria alternata]|uniref:Alpha-L-arabinofuranosidase n=2 Tax=Alternaria alternata complex TaxID=187734 RepID=A0A177D5S3_ALTAL|nr:arabinofuranosidase/B-xylosidase precursor [Alternaria alternata]RYN77769.1 putative alpha-L-arabinofuranosidase B [Alternaria tenuissima]KAH6851623.1 arabinofuranosidase/B-xylosidase precursor [Alternaria alternata]OAG14510.1 arabinofuranosidase/B-xylosidase precursor [Alternaria alternata]RYN92272.1 putative alpha-L-arabinofuranosidase B [Alternaria tenuissima]RYO08430.1 putative alpha-L-arabinofuranosidase B [Alternaria tenuissima]